MEITPQDTHTHTQPTLCIGYMERLGLDVKAQLKKREERCMVDMCAEKGCKIDEKPSMEQYF